MRVEKRLTTLRAEGQASPQNAPRLSVAAIALGALLLCDPARAAEVKQQPSLLDLLDIFAGTQPVQCVPRGFCYIDWVEGEPRSCIPNEEGKKSRVKCKMKRAKSSPNM